MAFDAERFRDLYPFTGHVLDRGGLRYHYLDEGGGEPVVCVHGNPTWSFHFRELVKALRDEFRVVAPDHIGCGLSDKPGDDQYDYTLASRVDDLEALLDHLGLNQNVTLVVHDWGGMIGFAAALRRPERIARLVVLNTAAFGLPAGKTLPLRLRLIRDVGPLGALLVCGLNVFARGAVRMAAARGLSADVREAYVAPYDSWRNRIATLRFVQDIPLAAGDASYELVKWVDDNLHRLRGAAMLILWGERDFVFDLQFFNEWVRRFPAAETHHYADAGHFVLEDESADVIKRIRAFLAKHALTPTCGPVAGALS
ncbi:MAG: alpha/beta fold hydrolase [Planctomycetes bacterium]|nr:alpha/beta fold hydrolase [Planctomycetota bacterium]